VLLTPRRGFTERQGNVGSMPCQSYRNPALVETIISALARFSFRKASWPADSVHQRMEDRARARLAEGVEVIHLLSALVPRPVPDRIRILIEALNSEDFITVPKIDAPVRAIRVRYNQRTDKESVDLYTDSGIVRGSGFLLLLLPPSLDPESALVRFLIVNPDGTREEALKAVRNEFPDFAKRAFDRFWPQARKAASLPARAPPRAKRKQK
jgi:hypothetical protein